MRNKIILLSQRVSVIESYNERRDCLDQSWYDYINACGYIPVPVFNRASIVKELIDLLNPSGIILTGGNDLQMYGGNAPERDNTEKALLYYAVNKNIPVLGVCRGMQFINCYFGGTLKTVDGHVATKHTTVYNNEKTVVNSFHNYAVDYIPSILESIAVSDDGIVEAIKHDSKNIKGIMWHPEREEVIANRDIKILKELIEG